MAALGGVTRQRITLRKLEERRSLLRKYDPINLSLPSWEGRRIRDLVIAVREFDVDQGPLTSLVSEIRKIEKEADKIIVYVPEIVSSDLDSLERELNSILDDPGKVEIVEVVPDATSPVEDISSIALRTSQRRHDIQHKTTADQPPQTAMRSEVLKKFSSESSSTHPHRHPCSKEPSEEKLTITAEQLGALIRSINILSDTIREVVREVLSERNKYYSILLPLLLEKAGSSRQMQDLQSLSRELDTLKRELRSLLASSTQASQSKASLSHKMPLEHADKEVSTGIDLSRQEPPPQSDVFEDNPWAEVLLSKRRGGSYENREDGD